MKAAVSKTVLGVKPLTWVRIPPSPPPGGQLGSQLGRHSEPSHEPALHVGFRRVLHDHQQPTITHSVKPDSVGLEQQRRRHRPGTAHQLDTCRAGSRSTLSASWWSTRFAIGAPLPAIARTRVNVGFRRVLHGHQQPTITHSVKPGYTGLEQQRQRHRPGTAPIPACPWAGSRIPPSPPPGGQLGSQLGRHPQPSVSERRWPVSHAVLCGLHRSGRRRGLHRVDERLNCELRIQSGLWLIDIGVISVDLSGVR